MQITVTEQELFLKLRVNVYYKNNEIYKTPGDLGGGQNLERRNVKQPLFRNFKITNIKITENELFDSFIFEFIFSLFINYLYNLIIFQIVKY